MRGGHFALILFALFGTRGKVVSATVVGCGLCPSQGSAKCVFARYPAMAMIFNLRFIL